MVLMASRDAQYIIPYIPRQFFLPRLRCEFMSKWKSWFSLEASVYSRVGGGTHRTLVVNVLDAARSLMGSLYDYSTL